jgi:putative glutathione S-transferase
MYIYIYTTGSNAKLDFYPEQHRSKIDEINAMVYTSINDGVYKSGFCRTQEAYDEAVTEVFKGVVIFLYL